MMRPAAVYLLDGMVEARRLSQELGLEMDLTPAEVEALGRSMHGPPAPGPAPEPSLELLQALESIAQERDRDPHPPWPSSCRCTGCQARPRPAPDPSTTFEPNISNVRFGAPEPLGRVDAERARTSRIADRNGKNDRKG